MDDVLVSRCACGWEARGAEQDVVAATIDHGRRVHNMEATREQVLAAATRRSAAGTIDEGVPRHDKP